MLRKKTSDDLTIEPSKSTFPVAVVFVLAAIVFAVFCCGLFYLRYSSISPLYKLMFPEHSSVTVSDNLQKQIDNPEIKTVELKITENQIGETICISCDSFPLRNAELQVKPDGITITGKTSNYFWGINVEVTIKPKIENEKIAFDIIEIKAAGVTAPPKIADSISSNLKELFQNVVPTNNTIAFKNVYDMVGYIMLTGVKK